MSDLVLTSAAADAVDFLFQLGYVIRHGLGYLLELVLATHQRTGRCNKNNTNTLL